MQLGRAAGARVTATVRDEARREAVGELGARAIDPEGFAEHGPFDVILELVGGPNLAGNLEALETGGRICVIGVGGGPKTEINLFALMGKRGRIHGSTLRARPLEQKAAAMRAVERHVLPLLDDGARARAGGRDPRPRAGGRGLRALRGGRQARQDRPDRSLTGEST